MDRLYNNIDIHSTHSPLISENLWNIVKNNKNQIVRHDNQKITICGSLNLSFTYQINFAW